MVKNFLIVAMRTMRKHKSYTIMNVAGLATGLACFMVIAMYVRRETEFDTFQKNPDRLFRIALHRENTGSPQPIATVSHSVADILRREAPGIESMARLFRFDQDAVILTGDKKFTEPDLMFAEPDVFDLLSIELLNGSPANALKNPTDAVLSEASARAYFGHTDVIGQNIRVRINTRYADFKITGVFKNYPSNSHFYTNVLLGFDGVKNYVGDLDFFQSWFNYPMWTYLRIKDINDEASVNAALHQIVERHFPQTRKPSHMQLQRVTDIHLHSQMSGEIRPNSNIFYIYTFAIIGLLLLAVACVNYINLSTAQSEQRTREVGVRKVMGARRRELIFQFLMESVLQSILALGLALGLAEVLASVLNRFTDLQLTFDYSDPFLFIFSAFLIVVVGVGAGFYPAVVLSGYAPIRNLRMKAFRRRFPLRKILVIVQLSVTAALISAVWIIQLQINYVRSKELGFNKDHTVLIRAIGSTVASNLNYDRFKYQCEQLPGVISVTRHSWVAGEGFRIRSVGFDSFSEEQRQPIQFIFVGEDYLKTYDLKLIEGRDFSAQYPADTAGAYIVNEAAVRAYGLTNPIGRIVVSGDRGPVRGPIVGVVKDFHFASLHEAIEPMVIGLFRFPMPYISVRFDGQATPETIGAIERLWNNIDTERPIDYSFLDTRIERVYRFENQLSAITKLFTILSMIIGCMGLFGLIAAMAEKRTKEIGIRKVLGASIWGIIGMFAREFSVMVIIATLLAVPTVYSGLSQWLEGFAYRVEMTAEPFIVSFIAILFLTVITVTHHALKAAKTNPAVSLKSE